jgi:hypothetical protein
MLPCTATNQNTAAPGSPNNFPATNARIATSASFDPNARLAGDRREHGDHRQWHVAQNDPCHQDLLGSELAATQAPGRDREHA